MKFFDKSSTESKGFRWKHCAMIGITVFLLYLCITYWPYVGRFLTGIIGAAAPLLIGCVIAYILNILMSFYEHFYAPKSVKKAVLKTRRPVCLVLAVITLFAIISLVVGLVLPQFIECVTLILNGVPAVAKRLIAFLDRREILTDATIQQLKSFDWQSWVGKAISVVSSGIGNVMQVVISTVSSVFSGVVTAVLSFIFALYILISKETLSTQVKRICKTYLNKKWYNRLQYAVGIFDECFHSYIVGQCIEAVILGTLCTLGMLILQLPYAPMIGALIALTALVPIAGAYIGAGVGAFLILMESPIKAFVFIVFIVVLQQFEGNVIYPKVVGTSIGLPGIWVLAAVTVGGGVMGVGGMLLGVPFAAAVYRIFRNDIRSRNRLIVEEGVEDAYTENERVADSEDR